MAVVSAHVLRLRARFGWTTLVPAALGRDPTTKSCVSWPRLFHLALPSYGEGLPTTITFPHHRKPAGADPLSGWPSKWGKLLEAVTAEDVGRAPTGA